MLFSITKTDALMTRSSQFKRAFHDLADQRANKTYKKHNQPPPHVKQSPHLTIKQTSILWPRQGSSTSNQ